MQYRRSYKLGSTFFFTLVTYQRIKLFANVNHANLLRLAIQEIKSSHPFKMDAFVLLPDHFHCIWTLPENDYDYSTRWRLIKSYVSRKCPQDFQYDAPPSRKDKNERLIWQRRFWEHQIRNENDFIKHVEYIHYNPVKHGYTQSPTDWPYTSFHHYVKAGIYPKNWGSSEINFQRWIGNE